VFSVKKIKSNTLLKFYANREVEHGQVSGIECFRGLTQKVGQTKFKDAMDMVCNIILVKNLLQAEGFIVRIFVHSSVA